ncbi:hypothetical protein QWZ16_24355 [Vibrio ostreicida]|uniref:Uncharacterized protein n=1 Tax=Vibrio ostreicida TaxID=526588 RepID=A0ABT8C0B9_9VIBR|nr:hypothetical protein [Vibrio ostreicida]MDN3612708.1 hypothetical protein [Vibrio ostreicida]
MLQLVIEKSGTDMTAVVDTREVNQNRMRQLVENNELDLFDTGLMRRWKVVSRPFICLLRWDYWDGGFYHPQRYPEKNQSSRKLAELTKFVMDKVKAGVTLEYCKRQV